MIPQEHADAIASVCDVDLLDLDRLWDETANVGYPILPLIQQVAARLPDGPAGQVHLGATTQDIMDTGLALQLSRALDRLEQRLVAVGDACVVQVERHRAMTMAARTHGQQAVPTTFGAKVAILLDEFARHRDRLRQARPRICRLSLFGAGGTSAAYGSSVPALRSVLGRHLGLEVTGVPWHVARDALAEWGFLCAALSETCARLAREIVDLGRTEIGEAREADGFHRGASSTMPQKANPVTCESIIGLAVSTSSTSSALLRAMEAGHERASGEWQIEWDAVPRLACLSSAALGATSNLLDGLAVDPGAMQRNMRADGGALMAEAYMMALAPIVGRQHAHDLIYQAVRQARRAGLSLWDELQAEAALDGVLDAELRPDDYLGQALETCDEAVRRWASRSDLVPEAPCDGP